RDLADAVSQAVPGTSVSINKAAPPDTRSYKVDFSLFAALAPHHQPQVTLRQSIDMLIEGLRRMGFADPDFRNSSYIRLKVLEAPVAPRPPALVRPSAAMRAGRPGVPSVWAKKNPGGRGPRRHVEGLRSRSAEQTQHRLVRLRGERQGLDRQLLAGLQGQH